MDAGTEFVLVRKWCAENNIKTYLPYSSFHGAFIEWFNQSIKNLIYRWMDSNKTENYIDSLGSILEGYNNSTHSSIGLPPNIAWSDKSSHPRIREKLQVYYDKFNFTQFSFCVGGMTLGMT